MVQNQGEAAAAAVTPTELLWYPTTHTKSGTARVRTVPGHEFSGVITAIGKDVQDFEVGDEVYGMNDWFADGATAEFCITLPQNIARKPATLGHEAAASVPIGALTSWQGLIDRAKLEPGERVLVHGGAGAVGLFSLGGSGSGGGKGGTVTLNLGGTIKTGIDGSGDGSHGVVAQSIGGGGGEGGFAVSVSPVAAVGVGGKGGTGGDGGSVNVQPSGAATIETSGASAIGLQVLVQEEQARSRGKRVGLECPR